MAWRVLLAPLWMAVLAGGWIAVVAYGRREAWGRWPLWPFAFGGAALFIGLLVWQQAGGTPLVAEAVVVRGLGVAMGVVAALFAFLASRARTRATLLLGQAPRSMDEAVGRVRAGETSVLGVFSGRIGSSEQVASPSGVVCALYEAEVREAPKGGVKGTLLAVEKAAAPSLYVKGERCRAKVLFAEGAFWAPVQIRRCRMAGRLSVADNAGLAGGIPPWDVVSYEKLAKLGEPCVVVGKLSRGLAEGTYVVKGPHGGSALIALGEEVSRVGRQLLSRSWGFFSASAAACVFAAWLLAG
jgi:hypothetical protein